MNRKVWYVVVVVAGAATGFGLSLKPWQIFSQQRAEASHARSEMQSMEAQQLRLMERKSQLESPLGREEMLRKKGYVKKGEVPLTLED